MTASSVFDFGGNYADGTVSMLKPDLAPPTSEIEIRSLTAMAGSCSPLNLFKGVKRQASSRPVGVK